METNPYVPPTNQVPSSENTPDSSPVGPIFGTIVVITLLALGGWYFWSILQERSSAELPFIQGDVTPTEEESWIQPTSNSDDAAAIEAELEAMNMDEFEQYMNADLDAASSQM